MFLDPACGPNAPSNPASETGGATAASAGGVSSPKSGGSFTVSLLIGAWIGLGPGCGTNSSDGTAGSLGGTSASGGFVGSLGGTASNGGSAAAGGDGGTVSQGGNASGGSALGGGAPSGGATATGGAAGGGSGGGEVGSCQRPRATCSDPQVRITTITVPVATVPYGQEGDTDPLPMALAALPNGGSRLAWLSADGHVYVAELDCNDQLVAAPFSLPAVDLQDIYADEEGGVVLLTRPASGSGADGCGEGPLCGGTSSPCANSYLVRFDNSGHEVWARAVTNATGDLDAYEDGARFIWWYQHHGRIAFDGSNYGTYFCIGITVQNGSCIDIHEGDRMQVVDSAGNLVEKHPDAFDFGCSHSWQTRIVWDPRAQHFVMVCMTDNDCRIARPNPYRTIAKADCDGTLFGGDLVLATDEGYWTAWSQAGKIRLDHFAEAASDIALTDVGDAVHPHLVPLGQKQMLLAWESGSGLKAQVRDRANGATFGPEFSIAVQDHSYQAFKAYADGSVAYPAIGSAPTEIQIARVMACE